MPWAELGEVATGVRRVARLLLTLISTMDQGFDRDMQVGAGAKVACSCWSCVYSNLCVCVYVDWGDAVWIPSSGAPEAPQG